MATSSAPLARLTEVSTPATPKVEVDDLDLALLRALALDARQSQRALARAIEMSPPAATGWTSTGPRWVSRWWCTWP